MFIEVNVYIYIKHSLDLSQAGRIDHNLSFKPSKVSRNEASSKNSEKFSLICCSRHYI